MGQNRVGSRKSHASVMGGVQGNRERRRKSRRDPAVDESKMSDRAARYEAD